MSKQPIYNFKGTEYLITYKGEGIQDEQWFLDQLKEAELQGDWATVNNKITGGLTWGHVKHKVVHGDKREV
jgi:hypothetical protein